MPDSFRAIQQQQAFGSMYGSKRKNNCHGCPCCYIFDLKFHKRHSIRKARRNSARLWQRDWQDELDSEVQASIDAAIDAELALQAHYDALFEISYLEWERETELEEAWGERNYSYWREDVGRMEVWADHENFVARRNNSSHRDQYVHMWLEGWGLHNFLPYCDYDYDYPSEQPCTAEYAWDNRCNCTLCLQWIDNTEHIEDPTGYVYVVESQSLTAHHNRKR